MKHWETDFHFDLYREALKLNLGIAQDDNHKLMEMLSDLVPMQLHEYPSGAETNGWVVPPNWVVRKAEIRKDGKLLFDGMQHHLAVPCLSRSFKGTISKAELEKHVFFSENHPNSIVYHSNWMFRPWEDDWGFCVPYALFSSWDEGQYEIDLDVVHTDGKMILGELFHKGKSNETIVFNAHTCHATLANDDMSGVMVLIEIFRWLQGRDTHYSYLGIIAPEMVGPVFYLSNKSPEERAAMKLGVFLESVGSNTPMALQQSMHGDSLFDRMFESEIRRRAGNLTVGPFRGICGNDEVVWEAPGHDVPMVMFTRHPFHEYHTIEDTIDILSPEKLGEALDVCLDCVTAIEQDRTLERQFVGLPALSNPKYGLYTERPDPAVKKELTEIDLRFGEMQSFLPRLLGPENSVYSIAEKFDLPFERLLEYLRRFEEKGLIRFNDVPSLDFYNKFKGRSAPVSSLVSR